MILKKILPLLVLLCLFNILNAQDEPVFHDHDIVEEEEIVPKEIFVVVEDMPRFPGCEEIKSQRSRKECANKNFLKYLYQNIEYPAEAGEQNISCNVVVQFIVLKDGTIGEVKVVRDAGGGCGTAAKKAIEALNENGVKFIPGRQRGVAVNVRLTQPIKFSPGMHKSSGEKKSKSQKKKKLQKSN